jgi:hypothetical protein
VLVGGELVRSRGLVDRVGGRLTVLVPAARCWAEPMSGIASEPDWSFQARGGIAANAYGPAARILCAVSRPLASAASTVPISRPA